MEEEKRIDIALSNEVAEGIYSNLAIITHSHSEFIVDFVSLMPGVSKGNVKSRIILTPQHAKRLSMALMENINRYEAMHGVIADLDPTRGVPINIGMSSKGDA
jgi:ribonuclease BN (tRNA processing enzyme)